jgi:hypothetical protein
MGILYNLFGAWGASARKSPAEPAPVLTPPTRLFLITDQRDISSIHELMAKNGYDLDEIILGENRFFFGAERDLPPDHFRATIEGTFQREHWSVRITLRSEPEEALQNPETHRNLALRLQELTQALDWEKYWLVEGQAPLKIAA